MSRHARVLVAVATIALLLVACDGSSSSDTAAAVESTATSETDQVPETTTTTMAEPPGIEDLPPALQAEFESLIATTEEIRGLSFLEPPAINVVTPEELEVLVRESIEEETGDLEVDQATYELLGLIDADTDLFTLYADLYGEQVAGYYDLETREMVVPMRSDGFSPLEKSTIVHELTHALTDQNFGLADRYEALFDEERFDEGVAYQALIEGDAVLTELLYLQRLSLEEQRAILEESLDAETDAFDATPQFIQESLYYPYIDGPVFVQRLYDLGGFPAVDQAYLDPPVSTEQILSPGDYLTDTPVDVDVLNLDVDGYDLEYDTPWGELGFELMFNQVLGGRVDAVNGWGGDQSVTLYDGENVVLVIAYRGDTPEDAVEMNDALLDYVPAAMDVGTGAATEDGTAFSGDDFAYVGFDGTTVLFLAASDPGLGSAMVGSLPAA